MKLAVTTIVAAALLAMPVAASASAVSLNGSPRVAGDGVNDQSGTAVASAGDVNGDGRDDVIVGSPLADGNSRHDSGSAYVVYGGPRLGNVDLGNLGAAGFRIDGARKNDHAGQAAAAVGDVNGDGIADVIVGAPGADDHARTNSGAAYVIYGRRLADPGNVDLAKIAGTQASRGMRIDGAFAGDAAGTAVSGGSDMNFDQRPDLLVGAPKADNGRTNSGSAYVVFGGRTRDPADVDLARITGVQAARGARMDGAAAGDQTGSSLAATADMNDDGIADAIIGAPFASANGRTSSGSAYVVYGQNGDDLPDLDLLDLATTQAAAGMRIDGAVDADIAGQSVAGGRDLNGDGIGDAVVGAPFADNNDRISSGSAYVIYGRPADAPDVDLANITTTQADRGMRVDGAKPDDRFGSASASAGNLAGDQHPDAIVTAPFADNRSRDVSGSAYVLYGVGMPDPPDLDLAQINGLQSLRGQRIDGAAAGDAAGTSVAAGDATGDRHPDAIVGAPGSGGDFSGSTYLLNLHAPG